MKNFEIIWKKVYFEMERASNRKMYQNKRSQVNVISNIKRLEN